MSEPENQLQNGVIIRNLNFTAVSRYRKWSPEEDEQLENLSCSHTISEIASIMERSIAAVTLRLSMLHISLRLNREWYTEADVADICGVSAPTVKNWIESARLAAYKYGRKLEPKRPTWKILREDFAHFICRYPMEVKRLDYFPVIVDILRGIEPLPEGTTRAVPTLPSPFASVPSLPPESLAY